MSVELKQLAEKIQNEWTEFQADNDRRLKEIEAKGRGDGKGDPLTEEKIQKHSEAIGALQKQIDEVQKKASRKGPGSDDEKAEAKADHRKAFGRFMRKGHDDGLLELQEKAVNVSSDPQGGYAVPESTDSAIEQIERDNAPMREVCDVMTVSGEGYEKLVNKGTASSGWVDEQESRAETNTPELAALKPYFGEIYANPAATQKSLDDMAIDVEKWLADEVGIEFALQENDAFTTGNGVKKPKGILSYTLVATADGARAFGEIEKLHSGSSGAFVADKLIDLVHKLHRGYRQGAMWMTTTLGLAAIRKLKDSVDGYLFQPSWQAGQPATILGYPVVENDDVPVPAADANAAIFGNFKRGYLIADVRGVRVLRDPYTAKPKVLFYTTKRMGGMVKNDRALKVYTLSA